MLNYFTKQEEDPRKTRACIAWAMITPSKRVQQLSHPQPTTVAQYTLTSIQRLVRAALRAHRAAIAPHPKHR